MHLVQGVFQFCLLGVLAGLLEQDVTIPDVSDLLFKVAHNYKEKRINIKNDILPCFSCQGCENLANVVKAEDESYQPQTSVDK